MRRAASIERHAGASQALGQGSAARLFSDAAA